MSLILAEEIIDLQTVSEPFQGKDYPLTTGRVLLHALDTGQGVLCGRPAGDLLAVDRSS